jgi:DNA modification methylase
MEIKKISEVKLNPNNPRLIKDDKFKKLVQSVKDFPEMLSIRPIVVNQDMIILGGNMRFRACKEAGITEIPVIVTDLPEDKQREFLIKDNTSGGEWDWDMIANEWDTDELEAWGLDLPVFDIKDEGTAEEDNYEVPDTIETDIVLGDLFEIGEHRLLCGDSTDSDAVARLMDGKKADMVFTDPPYGVSYTGGHDPKYQRKMIENDELQGGNLTDLFYEALMNADLFSHDHSAFYIWYSTNKSVETFNSFANLNLQVRAVLCWYKVKSGLGAFMAQYIPNFEPFIYAFKKGKSPQWFGASDEKSVWELKKDSKNDYHPTQKPVELPERAMKNSSKLGDIVLDLFGGSGSTMVAANQLKRKARLMEFDPKYCQVIVERMQKLDPNLVIKKNGQPYGL